MRNKALALTAISLGVLVGCSSSHTPEFQRTIDSVSESTAGTFEDRIRPHTPQRDQIGKVVRGPVYHNVDDYSLIERDDRRLPEVFEQEVFIRDRGEPFTVDEFSALLYRSYGIILDVSSPDLSVLAPEEERRAGNRERRDEGSPFRNMGAGVASDSVADYDITVDLIDDRGRGRNQRQNRRDMKLEPFEFSGTVRELLDYVSILNGVKWSYDNEFNRAYMYAYETRTFLLHDFGENRQEQTRITTSSTQDAESTSGGSNRQVSRESSMDTWEQIQDSISGMLSPEGNGRASFNQKTGMVTVTDSDYVLSRVNSFINEFNTNATRPITVQYSIIRFNYNETDNKGINQNYLNNQLTSNLLGDFSFEGGAGSLSPDPSGNLGAFQEIVGGNFLNIASKSHEVLLGFLNRIGTAEVAFSKQVEVMNNDVYIHQGGDNQEYISSIQRSTIREGVGQENITTEKDVAVDGVNISIKPRVVGDQIMVNYSIAYSDFIGLTDAGLGAGLEGVKLKQDSSLDISHNTLLRNGEFRIVEYTDERSQTADSQGFLNHGFWFLGGNERRSETKSVFIVTMAAFYSN